MSITEHGPPDKIIPLVLESIPEKLEKGIISE